MVKNEEIREKYPFFWKRLIDFEAEWIMYGCIYKVRKREGKTIVTLWIFSSKNVFLTA